MNMIREEKRLAAAVSGPQPDKQWGTTETYSKNILGPVFFTLSNLAVAGTAGDPLPPEYVAPGQSPYIIASDEAFIASVKVSFNSTPLAALLMCLGTKVTINFHFEGQGGVATEIDLSETIETEKDVFDYAINLKALPNKVGLAPGLYMISATAIVGPSSHKCSQKVLGYGYISKVLLQVYEG